MTFQTPLPIGNSQIGSLAIQAIRSALVNNPLYGTPIYHHQAQIASADFNKQGQPDYLSANPGVHGSGINYVPNPANPLRGIFCPSPRKPYQDKGGIYYQAQMEIYLLDNIGEIFVLENDRPKRQDKFVINNQTYYCIAPAFPCQMGEAIAAWKIELNLERYPVKN